MLDALRTTLHHALVTPFGDSLAPVRITKDLARRLNVTLGQPICSAEDLATRRRAQRRLEELNRVPRSDRRPEPGSTTKVLAPVKVYFQKDRNTRELTRVRELLDARAIVYDLLDVTGDEATLAFVTREAKVDDDDLPVVFLGPTVIGGFEALANADLSSALTRPS
jgi:hypothetical protein